MINFDKIRLKNRRNNEIRHFLDELEEMVFTFKIKGNPLLRKMSKEDWIVNVNNKAMLCWASKYTIDFIRAGLLAEEPRSFKEEKMREKK